MNKSLNTIIKSLFLTLLIVSFSGNAAEYIVKLKQQQFISASAIQISSISQVSVMDNHVDGALLKININSTDQKIIDKRLEELSKRDDVDYVVKNIKMHAFEQPNDPNFTKQWALEKVKAAQAWDITPGSREVVVAVIDTGVDYKHEDLADNIWFNEKEVAGNGVDDDNNGYIDDVNGWDFNQNDSSPMDDTSNKNPGHGTHCAGIVGAVGNNQTGICGMSQAVSMMPVRFLGADGSGDLYAGAKAIDYATNNGAHIISASWGAAAPRQGAMPIIEAIQRANEKGVIFVAAAGNDGSSNDTRSVFPANAGTDNMVVVAASNANDGKPQWSNFGLSVDIAAPGENILSTLPAGKYANLSGTSMATPLVSGMIALLLSNYDQEKRNGAPLTADFARSILQYTGAKVDIQTACNCRIDAAESLKALNSDETFMVTPAAAKLEVGSKRNFKAFGGKAPYTFASSDEKIATIDQEGLLTALVEGKTIVSITDADGNKTESLAINIGGKATEQPPGGGMKCPLRNPQLCRLICIVMPKLPWC